MDRPNLMIKVPGTKEGWPAVERLLVEGVNINITLLFSLEHYRQVAEAYLRALEARVRGGQRIDRLASVASFFVSRVDTEADRRLEAKGGPLLDLRGKVGVANAQLAYAWFRELLGSARWKRLADAGARPQRLLWASTGTKNPAYSDVLYVDSLIGADTINTMPPATLQLFEDHGTIRPTLSGDASDARAVMERLAAGGVDIDDVTRVLEDDGIDKFVKSFDALLGVIATKRKALAAQEPPGHSAVFPVVDAGVAVRLDAMDTAQLTRRIWAHDPTVWKPDPDTPEIRDRLGWLTVGKAMAQQAKSLTAFADEVRAEFQRVVLCGMGGSSLAPEVLWRTFGAKSDYPSLQVLDSTDPRAVRQAEQGAELEKTLFIISSKSGTTQESDSFFRHFWERTGGRGSQFVAITDPGTPLERLAGERRFRRTFLNPPDIGGRYSALSYFGLVPAALIGVDVGTLLHRAHRMAEACAACVPALDNPGGLARRHPGRGRAGRARQGHVRALAGDRELRAVGRAADRREHREGRQGHPARGRRAAGRARGVRRRPGVRVHDARGRAGPAAWTRVSPSWRTPAIRSFTCGWTTASTWGRSSSAGSSLPRWRARCSASTRSTSRTSPRARRTPRRCWRSAAPPRRPRRQRSWSGFSPGSSRATTSR